MSQIETTNVLRIVMKHLLEAENPPQLLAETQEVLLKCSKNNKLARNIYQRYLALPLLVRYAYAERFEWFEAVAEQRQGEDNNTLTLEFQMIKIESFYAIFYSISEEIREKFEQPGHTLLFHGAKQASSVDDVLNNGINLNCGRSHLDFSSGSGFYLSDDYEAAEEWVTKKEHRPSAVIIYRVPNNLLEYGKTAGVDLNKQTWLWSYIVKYYRREHTFGFDLMDLVLNRSFYKGPVCRNGVQIRKGNHDSPTPLVINGKEIQQYCIRRKNLAQKFNSLVVGVVIYV